MEAHEQQEEARRKAREAAMSEDGWTVVVRSKVRPPGWSCAGQLGGTVQRWQAAMQAGQALHG